MSDAAENVKNFSENLQSGILLAGFMVASFWFVPPMMHSARHLCPVRPDGVSEADAIPAFARKYGYSCETCHTPSFPKLNDFGNQFKDKGYQTGSDADVPALKDIPAGYWPVSFRTTVGYQYATQNADGSGINSGGFGFTGLDILSFGVLDKDVSFGVVYTPGLGSAGFGTAPSAGSSDLEAAFVRLSNIQRFVGLGEDNYWMNLKIGKIEPDYPFSEHRSPTLNTPFVMYHYQAGTPYTGVLAGMPSLLSYKNPNDFAFGDNHPGAELFGFTSTPGGGTFRYALTALSNSDINTGGSGGGKGTNFYGHVTQSFGGYGIVTGQRIGVFGAYGEVPTMPDANAPAATAVAGDGEPFSRIGVDFSLTLFNQFNLFGAAMQARDTQNLFVSQGIAAPQEARWTGGFVQLDYVPASASKWLLSYRYDLIRNQYQGDSTFNTSFNDVDSHTWLARYNFVASPRGAMAWHFEYNRIRDKGVGANGGDLSSQAMLTGFDFSY